MHIDGGGVGTPLTVINFRAFTFCRFCSGSAALPKVEGTDVTGI